MNPTMNSAEIAHQLWDSLWQDYSHRVEYARIYQQMIHEAGGTIVNDHIAFRSLRLEINNVNLGISYLASLVETLGYQVGGEYRFPDRHLYARHYYHPQQDEYDLPKLFISELIVEELPDDIVQKIIETVSSGYFFNINNFQFHQRSENLVKQLQQIFTCPWQTPKRSVVEAVNSISQYGAWVLLHGYSVNHFTGYINRHNTSLYPDIESTAQGLSKRGIPMKLEIEGSRGTGLRQTATQAVTEMVTVIKDETGKPIQIPWTYAYYEIAERNLIEIAPGKTALFQGFLDAQAKNLFEMTRLN